MKEQSAAGILETTTVKVKNLFNVSTIIGEPMNIDGGITIIPVSKVTYGFASGGSDFPSKTNKEIFGGGGGAGVTITPVAFLVISDGEVTIKHITAFDNAAERVVNLVPEMFDKVTSVVNKAKKEKEKAARDAQIASMEVGTVLKGTVETLQNYGAFVKLENGLSGLVHVSQISQKRVKMPSDVLTVGDEVEVKVIGIKDGKISLSMKALEEDKEKAEEKAEKVVIPKAEDIGTNLGDLFKNIQL